MALPKIGSKIVLEGEAEYRNALKNINAAQKENRSEMKLWSAEFKENQNCTEALTKKHEILTKQIETQKQKVAAYEAALEKNSKAEENAAKKVSDLQSEYNNAAEEMKKMQGNAETTAEALEEQKKKVEDLKGKLELAQTGYDATTRKLADYKTSLNFANAEQRAMESELERTEKHLGEAKTALDGNATSIDRYGKEVQEAAKETSLFGEILKAELLGSAIKKGIEELAEGITKIATAATEAGTTFEASMSQVAATMGMTAEEVNNGSASYTLLSDAAKECGKSTMFSAGQAGDALNYLALAGYDAEKAAKTLPKVLDLAAAGGLDLAYASDLVTDSMAALGMETDELDKYIDQMAKTSQRSNTSVAELGEATLVCAGTVSLAGQSLETMNTELGVLANNGIKGAEGGTHLRNVILSLSAPTDTAANAMESLGLKIADSQGNMRDMNDIMTDLDNALSEMSAVEKTQTISKIFNKTDIAAVNALLKGTGAEYDNLNAEIKNCSGAASQMAETLNNNLKGKVTELQSGLEGLGITAYEIFDDDMKKAVDSATNAVRKLQNSMDGGSLGVSMSKLAESMGEFAEKAIDVGEGALPVVIDGFTWILDNSDLVMAGITGIVAANIEMNVVAPAVQAVTAAWSAYQTANEGATVSQWLLNTAMNANPAGIIITAVTALTAAVAAYIIMQDDENEKLKEWNEQTKELSQSSKQLEENIKNAGKARSEERSGLESEAEVCKNLAKELQNLQAKTKLTKTEQEKQRTIIDQLNKAMPDLNLCIDEQTGLLNKNEQEIEKSIDALYEYYKAQAAREHLAKIAEEQFDAEVKLYELEKQKEEIKNKIADTEERVQNLQDLSLEKTVQEGENLKDLKEELETYNEALKTNEEDMEGQNAALAALGSEYQTVSEIMENTEGLETAAGATQELGNAAEDTGGKLTGMSEAAQEAYQEMSENLTETISGQMNLFSEFDAKVELSTQELLSNMESQIEGISKWSENIKTLADRGIDQGLLKNLAEMGPEGAGYVAAFVEMTDEEIKKANELYQKSLAIPTDTTNEIMDSYMQAGAMAGEGFEKGIHNQYEKVDSAAREIGRGSVKTLKNELKIQSPSKETEEVGEYFDEGLENGINKGKQAVLDIICELTNSMIITTKENLKAETFFSIGENAVQGLIDGIDAKKEEALEAIRELCAEAEGAAETANKKITKTGAVGNTRASYGAAGAQTQLASSTLRYIPSEARRIEIAGYIGGSTPAAAGSTLNTAELTDAIARAVEKGIETIQFEISANVNERAIVDITVEANEDYRNRTGRSLYDG